MVKEFFIVIFSNIFSQLIAFGGTIVYARLLDIKQFGLYSFSYSIISFFLLFNGFGAASGILQYVSKANNQENKLGYLRFSFKLGILFNSCLSIIIFIYAILTPMPIISSKYILCEMALFPIGRLYIDVTLSYFRATQQNHTLSKFSIFSNSIIFIFNFLGIYIAKLHGFIVSTYISYIFIFIVSPSLFKIPHIFSISNKVTLPIKHSEFIKYSLYITISNAFSQLLFVFDIIVLGYIVKNTNVIAQYKVATIIPFAINFIPGIIISFFYPLFAKNANNKNYILNLKTAIQKKMFFFSFMISLFLILTAKYIITFLFGNNYHDSIIPFQILSFGFWIVSTFRIINSNILASIGKAKFSMWFNMFMMIINIILTVCLIKKFGIIGSAISVVSMYIISSVITSFILKTFLKSHF